MEGAYLDKKQILDSLTKEDVIKILLKLGSAEPKQDGNGNLIFQTICHNPPNANNSFKLYYYHEPSNGYKGRVFHCYTDCGDSFSIIELVIRAKRVQGKTITWYKALKYIGQVTGKLEFASIPDKEDEAEILDFDWIRKLKAAQNRQMNVPVLSEINENILDIFYYKPYEPWLNEHISCEAMSRFEIGYYGLTNQITIPHRDKDGRLIGIRGRWLDDEQVESHGKYMPLFVEGRFLSHKLGNNLYGLHVVKEKVMQCKKIMLVEAEKSCLQAYSIFKEDSFVVAVCGSNITKTQIRMILDLGVVEVILGFDRDYHDPHSYEAEVWWQKMLKKAAPLVPYVKVTVVADSKQRLNYQDGPFDQGEEIALELLDEKITVKTEDIISKGIEVEEK